VRALIFTFGLVLSLPGFRASAAAVGAAKSSQAEGLCRVGEQALFACATAKGLAYLCAARSTPNQSLVFQYRFGNLGNINLRYPASLLPPAGLFHFSTTMYGGGGEAHLTFDNAGYKYILFDRMVARDPDSEGHRAHNVSTGILVKKGNRILSNLACTRPDDSMRGPAYDLPREPFDYHLVP
jgi:hypothetical protein